MIPTITFLRMKTANTERSISAEKHRASIHPSDSWASCILYMEAAWGAREEELIPTDWPHTEVIAVALVLWAQAERSHLAHGNRWVLLHSGNYPTVPRDFTKIYILLLSLRTFHHINSRSASFLFQRHTPQLSALFGGLFEPEGM